MAATTWSSLNAISGSILTQHQELLATIQESFAVVCIAGPPNSNSLVTQAFCHRWNTPHPVGSFKNRLWVSDKLISWEDPQTQLIRKILLINFQIPTQGLGEEEHNLFVYLCLISSLMVFTSDSVSEHFGDQSWSELAGLASHLKKYSTQEPSERNWLHNSPHFLYVATNHNNNLSTQADEKFWKNAKSNRASQFISKFRELFSVTFDKNSFLSLPRDPFAINTKISKFFTNDFGEILEDLTITNVRVNDRSLHSISAPVVGRFDFICEKLREAVNNNDLSNDFVEPIVRVAAGAKITSTKEKLISQLLTEIQSCEDTLKWSELDTKKDILIDTITEECKIYEIAVSEFVTHESLNIELETLLNRPKKSGPQNPRQTQIWEYKNQLAISWKNLSYRNYSYATIPALESGVKELFFNRKGFEALVSIEKVMFINNPGLQANFERRLNIMTKTQKHYPTNYHIEKETLKAHMQAMLAKQLLEDQDGHKIQVAKGWVGIAPQQVEDLCEKGLRGIDLEDQGYFGKGFYTTPQAVYACHYADGTISKKTIEPIDGCYTVALCWVALGQVYPVCRDVDYKPSNHFSNFYRGQISQDLKSGFDSHHVCVASRLNYQAVIDFEGTGMSRGMVEEFVCRDSAQILPYCVVYFKKKLVQPPK